MRAAAPAKPAAALASAAQPQPATAFAAAALATTKVPSQLERRRKCKRPCAGYMALL